MYHIIVNPGSRSGSGLTLWETVIEPYLISQNVEYKLYLSHQEGDLTRYAKEISYLEEEDIRIVLLGGDGTINEALQEMNLNGKVTIGYIPTGSSNDLARDLKIPKEPMEALDLMLHKGTPHPMDLACVTLGDGRKRRYATSCGMGFNAAVCEETNRSKLKVFMNRFGMGKLAYLGIAIKILFAARKVSCKITLDNEKELNFKKILFAVTMVHRYEGGGFMFCPTADSTDGILDMCTVGDIPKLVILCALPTAFKGKHYMFKGVNGYKLKTMHMKTSEPLWVHTDGEILGKYDEITIETIEHGVNFIY